MPHKFSACIEMLFSDLDFEKRPGAALACGYSAVEFWQWHTKPLDALAEAGAPVLLALVDSRNEAARSEYNKIGLLRPQSASLFTEILDETLCALSQLNVKLIVVTPGQALSDLSRGAQEDNIVKSLAACEPLLQKHGAELVIEPLNPIDHKGCYLQQSDQAFRIVRAVGSDRIGVLFDIYHQQITEGNLIDHILPNINYIKHFHAADVPGRHEPGTGEINYANVLHAIQNAGYDRFIGCEFSPSRGIDTLCQELFSL